MSLVLSEKVASILRDSTDKRIARAKILSLIREEVTQAQLALLERLRMNAEKLCMEYECTDYMNAGIDAEADRLRKGQE